MRLSPLEVTLLDACARMDLFAMEKAISSGANIDAQDRHGLTPLIRFSASGNDKAVKLLLNYGANPNVLDGQGWTACMWATRNDHINTLKLLIPGSNLAHYTKGQGGAPRQTNVLSIAVRFERENCARLLLDGFCLPQTRALCLAAAMVAQACGNDAMEQLLDDTYAAADQIIQKYEISQSISGGSNSPVRPNIRL